MDETTIDASSSDDHGAGPASGWTMDRPWGYDSRVYRRATHLVSAYLLGLPSLAAIRLLFSVELRGVEEVARIRPPLLLVSNHQSLIDSYFVCFLIGLVPHGLIKEWIIPFHTPEESNFMAGPVGRAVHLSLRCVPLRRGQGLYQTGLETVIELLRRGRSLVYMFPEGTRSRDGQIGRATPGAGRVAAASGCSVLPVRIWGMDQVLPVGACLPRPGKKLRIRVGRIMLPEAFSGEPDTPRGWLQVSCRILDAIRELQW